jgi:hypothetical protein
MAKVSGKVGGKVKSPADESPGTRVIEQCGDPHCKRHHALHITDAGKQLILVRGARAYLWVGDEDGRHLASFGGELGAPALRQLADAIRTTLGERDDEGDGP